ncbi:MAG: protein-export chaperone SecB [Sneathiellaceae bacterium]
MSNADSQGQDAPSLSVTGQYVKDFSFENPNAPESLASDAPQPQIEVNVDVQARGFRGDMYEVVLRIHGHCRHNEDTAFMVELDYAGLFVLRNFPQEQLEQVCLIECPRLLFPFARAIVANATREGGFPPLLLDPIDFNQLYHRSRTAAAAPAPDEGAAPN